MRTNLNIIDPDLRQAMIKCLLYIRLMGRYAKGVDSGLYPYIRGTIQGMGKALEIVQKMRDEEKGKER